MWWPMTSGAPGRASQERIAPCLQDPMTRKTTDSSTWWVTMWIQDRQSYQISLKHVVGSLAKDWEECKEDWWTGWSRQSFWTQLMFPTFLSLWLVVPIYLSHRRRQNSGLGIIPNIRKIFKISFPLMLGAHFMIHLAPTLSHLPFTLFWCYAVYLPNLEAINRCSNEST